MTACQTSREKTVLFDKQIVSLQKALKSTSLLMEHGTTNYLEVLTARQTLLSAQLSQTANRFTEIQSALAEKYLPLGASGVVSFGVKGGRETAMKLMNSLRLAQIVVHVADARTCVLHPASTTHRQLTDQQLKDCGIGPEFIRFSVGIEDVSDIIADLQQALAQLDE